MTKKKTSLFADVISVGATIAAGKSAPAQTKPTGVKIKITPEMRAQAQNAAAVVAEKLRETKVKYDASHGKPAPEEKTGKIGKYQEQAKKAMSDAAVAKAVDKALDFLSKPEEEAEVAQTSAAPARESSDDLTKRLRHLSTLHSEGVLDDEEFKAAKAEVLRRL